MKKSIHPNSAKLGPWLMTLVFVSGGALFLTGAVWLVLEYFFKVESEFGTRSHPLQPLMLQMHGFFLNPMLIALGGMIFAHVGKGWRYKVKKKSGIILLASFAVLTLTGYILYYTGNLDLRDWSGLIHWVLGLALPLPLIWHGLTRIRRNSATSKLAATSIGNVLPAETDAA